MTLGYRPWLDGLRGIAIGLVMLAHFAKDNPLHDGFGRAGVGIFFGLSGYLITGLLLDEHEQGGIRLAAFYMRRVARLAPALLTMVAITSLTLWYVGATYHLGWHALAALTYTTNLANVLGWAGVNNPFGQTWSLAVEEHFYLLWAPVVLYSARRGGAGAVLRCAVIGALVSVLLRFGAAATGSTWWVGQGSLTRGDALLVGCAGAAALRLGFRIPRWSASLATVLVAASIFAARQTQDTYQFASALALLSVTGVVAVLALDSYAGLTRHALAAPPMVWLGQRSYSLYLWHFALLALLRPPLPTAEVLAMSLVIAELSYRLVERPAREAVRGYLTARQRAAVPLLAD